jgi:hypothetical protein
LQDPSLFALTVADAAPVFKFSYDFHGQALALENPGNGMIA